MFACFAMEPVMAAYENDCMQTARNQYVENTDRMLKDNRIKKNKIDCNFCNV